MNDTFPNFFNRLIGVYGVTSIEIESINSVFKEWVAIFPHHHPTTRYSGQLLAKTLPANHC